MSIRDLVRSSLRLRPDRIVVGEVRGEEALDLITAMNTGHGGVDGTTHANTSYDALIRLGDASDDGGNECSRCGHSQADCFSRFTWSFRLSA